MLYEKVHRWVDSPNYRYMLLWTVAHHHKSKKKNPQNEKHLNWSEHENNLLKFLSHVCEQLHYPKKVVNLDDASKMLNLCNTLHTLSSFDKASYTGMISLMNEFLKKGEYIIIVCINR